MQNTLDPAAVSVTTQPSSLGENPDWRSENAALLDELELLFEEAERITKSSASLSKLA